MALGEDAGAEDGVVVVGRPAEVEGWEGSQLQFEAAGGARGDSRCWAEGMSMAEGGFEPVR